MIEVAKMPKWTRKPGEITKSSSIPEGEVISLLLGSVGKKDSDLLDAGYESAKTIGESRGKAFSILATTTIVAILAKFSVISSLDTSGISVAETAFKPIALTGYSVAGLYFSYHNSRFRYFELWFESIFERSSPGRRAELLLRYPMAFDVFKFEPIVRGYPADTFPKGSDIPHLLRLILFLIALIVYGVLGLALWVSLSIDVWNEAFPNQLISAFVVISSVVTGVLAGCLPLVGKKKRDYDHYGLSSVLTRLQEKDPERHGRYWLKVDKALAASKQQTTDK
jgi:hypothetical protein